MDTLNPMKTNPSGRAAAAVALVVAAWATGCSRPDNREKVSYAELLRQWADPRQVARLDAPDSRLICSVDPAGGNDDYNHFLRKGPDGWVVLADLEGPGYVSRFWFTGADDGKHRLRFFFDGARQPTLDVALGEFCGGKEPWSPPLANYENYCWYNLIPIPFKKRLVIMAKEGGYKPNGWPRLFYQINVSRLPPGKVIESFTGQYTPEDLEALRGMRETWAAGGLAGVPDGLVAQENSRVLAPGESADLLEVSGPAMLRELAVTPDRAALPDALARERVVRDLVLRVYYDDREAAGIETPLGDFFGQVWRPVRYGSMFFTLTNDTFVSRFPMPFEKKIRVRVENQGAVAVGMTVGARVQPLDAWDPAWGYLHAQWWKTTPNDLGRPHPIAQAEGRGKYVGCALAVLSLDRNWWILEGDEALWMDGEAAPRWHGTGLEDYFNGGWYYQNVIARPVHGVPFKTFFRIAQYRLHVLDAPKFDTSFRMEFERGPDHASHGAMESVAWYYLATPAASGSRLGSADDRRPPEDPLAEATIMPDLLGFERFGDYRGAMDFTDAYLQRHPKSPFAAVLRLRQIACEERISGIEAARPKYEQFLAGEKDERALTQARLLLWFHENPSRALLCLSSTARARALVDGQETSTAEKPEQPVVVGFVLEPGRHALALYTQWSPYPSWLQAAVRTHQGLIGTAPDWKLQFKPAGAWGSRDYDDRAWPEVGGTGVKGPPEEPYLFMAPNAFVDLQSQAVGVRAADEIWPDKKGFFVFRRSFETP